MYITDSVTLLLPLGVTNLERKGLPRAAPTKLSLDALQDLIALAEEAGAHAHRTSRGLAQFAGNAPAGDRRRSRPSPAGDERWARNS